MLIIFSLILIVFFSTYITTKRYKKLVIGNLNQKEHPLKFLYGFTMFILDKLLNKFHFLNNDKESYALKALFIQDDIKKIQYMLTVKKITLCVSIFISFSILGLVKGIEEEIVSKQYVYKLDRPSYGEGSENIELEAELEGESNSIPIQIEIGEVKYSKEEILKKIGVGYKQLNKIALGKNSAWDNITESLVLVDSIQDLKVFWEIDNSRLIDFNGKINAENIEGEGVLTYIRATLSFEEIEKVYEIPLVIKPAKKAKLSLDEKIESRIEDKNSKFQNDVVLPTEIDNKMIKFINIIENQSGIFLCLAIIGSLTILISQSRDLDSKLKKRNAQMMIDYPEIVSKLTLLCEAGLSLSKAWNRVVEDYEKNKLNNKIKVRFAFEEMRLANSKMKNGTPEAVAYAEFAKRCNIQSYLKLGSLLEQNLTKGTKGLKDLLEQEVRNSFENRKNAAKSRGEEASTKLLFPMVLMLVIIIVIIVVPAFLSMKL